MLQACGVAVFLAAFARQLSDSRSRLVRAGVLSGGAALAMLLSFYALEAARMAGEFAGVLDPDLLELVAESNAAPAALRILGLGAVLVGLAGGRVGSLGVAGAGLVALSFAVTGHTLDAVPRMLGGVLVALHALLAAAWFGALLPLYVVSGCEPRTTAALVVARFSDLAAWAVPPIALAGVVLAWHLGVRGTSLGQPYAQLLVAKALTFALLMMLAAADRWRYGPRLASGDSRAARRFRRTVAGEYALVVGLLALTATLTTFYSPHE